MDLGLYYSSKSAEGIGKVSVSNTNSLKRHVFHVPQPTCMFAALYTLESVQTFVCLRMFDNDGPHQGTTIEVPQVFYQLRPQLCAPNKVKLIFGFFFFYCSRDSHIKEWLYAIS